jgi:hypothetical protein
MTSPVREMALRGLVERLDAASDALDYAHGLTGDGTAFYRCDV